MKHGLRMMLLAAAGFGAAFSQTLPPLSSNATVYATGLNNPRGLKFGPDGVLYIAEGGAGGSGSSAGTCHGFGFLPTWGRLQPAADFSPPAFRPRLRYSS